MAKMMVNYAVKVLWLKPDTTKTCNFSDINNQTPEMQGYIKLSCQLGLMWVDNTKFNPSTEINRAQFATVLSRALYGSTDKHDSAPYYTTPLQKLKAAWILHNINNPEQTKEIRGYVMLMMQRAKK